MTLTAADTGDHFWHGVGHDQCGGRVHDDAEFDPGERRRHRDGTDQRHGERDRQRRFHGWRSIADDLSLTAVPGTVTADGETTTTLTVTAKDAEGNVIPDATVTLTSADTGDHFGTVSGTTNAAGVFTDDAELDPGERRRHRDGTDQRHGERDRQRRLHGWREYRRRPHR